MKSDTVDMNALRFNQISIVVLVLIGFLADLPIFPGLVSAILLLGAINPDLSLFRRVYKHLLVPSGLMAPQPVADNGAAHRFAQLLGGLFLATSTVFLHAGSAVTGWSLAWVVILLAATNLFFGFCAGCFVYYQIARFRSRNSRNAGTSVREA
jgi:hypothetical protein